MNGRIDIYSEPLKTYQTLGGQDVCEATFGVRNGTDRDVALLVLNFIYDGTPTRWEQAGIASGSDRSVNYRMTGGQCVTMKGLGGPSVRAMRCEIGGMNQKECAKLLRFK